MNSLGETRRAVENHAYFKKASENLLKLPTDESAAAYLIGAFEDELAPPWLTAHLLGCIGHESGYSTTRQILLDSLGMLSESYAGVALARIRGVDALLDLIELMNEAPKKIAREGAAYGLKELAGEQAIEALIRASRKGLIRWNQAGGILAGLGIRPQVVLEMLKSKTERDFRVATSLVEFRAIDTSAPQWSEEDSRVLATELETTMNSTSHSLSPVKAKTLRAWIAASK